MVYDPIKMNFARIIIREIELKILFLKWVSFVLMLDLLPELSLVSGHQSLGIGAP